MRVAMSSQRAEEVLLRLGAEAGHLRVGDLLAGVGPGELRGGAHHRQHRLLLRGVDDRRHGRLLGSSALMLLLPPPEWERERREATSRSGTRSA